MAPQFGHQITFGSWLNQGILDPSHKLVKLSELVSWEAIHDALAPYYSIKGRHGLPIRLMTGLHLLKHMENMSDAQVTDRIRGDLYWMYFCGVEVDDLKGKYSHLNSSSMTKFRNRIGEKGFSGVENIIGKFLLDSKRIDPKVMSTDSSCQEKNVEYPTDSGLLNKGRLNLLKGMKTLKEIGVKAIKGVRTYSRRAKQLLVTIMKLGKDRAERIKMATLELSRQAVHVAGKSKEMLQRAAKFLKSCTDIQKQISVKKVIQYLKKQIELAEKVVQQSRSRFKGIHVPKKVYSLHEPQVIVIRKGKRARQNEYGSKFNISIDKNGYIVSHEIYAENKSDSKLLDPAIENWEQKTGRSPRQVNADRGYVQKKRSMSKKVQAIKKLCIPTKGKTKHPESQKTWFKNGQAMRAGIEAVIGHLKQDHRLDRSRYSGISGDKINLCLGSMAWNLGKLSRAVS